MTLQLLIAGSFLPPSPSNVERSKLTSFPSLSGCFAIQVEREFGAGSHFPTADCLSGLPDLKAGECSFPQLHSYGFSHSLLNALLLCMLYVKGLQIKN
ncbi:hypothetical protein CDAR_369131 [Caerostris darwini]|uniref:Uncharacterized protein n=1 Tax=Caerostris darwini TaxID=1538125 RepID=A0AAV4WKB4_9ARAC|nr:hypothetical protein CDAR_369071 [Caerostris darwini]GIY82976.1 hypothetical protein CDAR_369131 [Caerostris darwini]